MRLAKWYLRRPMGWRIVVAVLALLGMAALVWTVWRAADSVIDYFDEEKYYADRRLGNGYYVRKNWGERSDIAHEDRRRAVVKDVDWVEGSYGDSLWVVAKDGRRAYFNSRSGRMVTPFVYSKAWVYSEGVAAVVDTCSRVRFIDPAGRPAVDTSFAYDGHRAVDFVFHRGLCPMYDAEGHAGLIDRQGHWRVAPQYDSVARSGAWWALMNADSLAVADSCGRIVVGMTAGHRLDVAADGNLVVWHREWPARLFAPDGTPMAGDSYWNVSRLVYYEGEGESSGEKPTGLYLYQTAYSRMGLIDGEGRVLCKAVYSDIEALSKDLYKAEYETDCTTMYVILDRQGRVVDN